MKLRKILVATALMFSMAGSTVAPVFAESAIETSKDTIIEGIEADPGTLKYNNDMDVAVEVRNYFLERLMIHDGSEYQYDLAEEITEDEGGMGVTIKLKEGVQFSTGEELKASDVIWSMEIGREYYESLYDFVDWDNLEAVDDYTAHVPFTKETYLWRSLFCGYNSVGIYSQKAYEEAEANGTDFWLAPVSTGEYQITEWNADEDIRLEANEYYRKGAPAIKNMIIRIISESSVRLLELQTGGIDMMTGTGDTLKSAQEDENIEIYKTNGTSVHYIGINHKSEVFKDEKVRQAIAYLVDRQTLIDGALNGNGEVHNSMFSPSGLGYSDLEWPYEYNTEKALELFDEAGVDPSTLTLRLVCNEGSNRPQIAEQLYNMFSAVGITLEINTYDSATTTDILTNSPSEFDLYLRSLGAGDGEVLGLYFSDNAVGLMNIDEGGAAEQYAEWQKLLTDAMENPDENARKEAYIQADQMVLDNVFWIPLYVVPNYRYTTATLKDIDVQANHVALYSAYFE